MMKSLLSAAGALTLSLAVLGGCSQSLAPETSSSPEPTAQPIDEALVAGLRSAIADLDEIEADQDKTEAFTLGDHLQCIEVGVQHYCPLVGWYSENLTPQTLPERAKAHPDGGDHALLEKVSKMPHHQQIATVRTALEQAIDTTRINPKGADEDN
ncbi:MAG: hypothetical protein Q4P36_03715 [Bowdeniella nasicola]|nr:hypothetical protein [Bowdeniella nasicola]